MAANTGIYHGSDALLYVGGTAAGHSTSHSIETTSELKVRRTKDTGKFPTRKLTGIDAHVNLDALVMYDGYSYKNLLTAQLAGTQLTLTLRGHSNATWGVQKQIGDWYLQLPVKISNTSKTMPVNDDGSYTCGFDLDGTLEIKTET
jgi:hypothetical protein